MSRQIVGHFTEFVGRRIANRRKAKKITPEEMARKIGVSVKVLDHMEHGYDHINLEQLLLFTRYLTTTGDLLGLPHYSDEEMQGFIDARVNAMTPEQLLDWKTNPEAPGQEHHRLFILDFGEEPQ